MAGFSVITSKLKEMYQVGTWCSGGGREDPVCALASFPDSALAWFPNSSLVSFPYLHPTFSLRVRDAKDSYGVETGNETVQEAVLYPGGCIGLRYGQCFSVQNRRGGLIIFTVKRMLMDTMRCGHHEMRTRMDTYRNPDTGR